jgi:nucleotide-binding universal stress UspA family protein
MNPWIVLPWIVALALVFVLVPVGAATFTYWRRPFRLTCPRTGARAQIRVAAAAAARGAMLGLNWTELTRCSLWTTTGGCRAECLALPATALSPASPGEPPPRAHDGTRLETILVPLDGAPASEQVLDAVAALARAHGSRVRLLHVATATDSIRDVDGRILAFADQVTASLERQAVLYFRRLEARFPGVRIDGTVRFGDPVVEIVDEAESVGADVIALRAPTEPAWTSWLGRSVPRRVGRTTTIPLLLLRQGAARAA